MSTRHLVDPELLAGVDAWPQVTLDDKTLPLIRAARADLLKKAMATRPAAADIEASERFIPGPQGAPPVRVLVYRPQGKSGGKAGPLPAYLHIHGGGFVMGSPGAFIDFDELFVREVGCVVVSVGYRLAPETRFPGGLEDCYAALAWMHREAAALGIDPQRIAVGGESAGGGLAAGLALLARERGQLPIAFQLLIYPVLDDRTGTSDTPNPVTGEFIWTRASNVFAWRSLLGTEPGGADVSPYAAPARAPDLRGLPPAFVSTGSLDLFLDEDLEYARRLIAAGVPTEVHVYPGAPHGFELITTARVTKDAMRDRTSALRRALQPSGEKK